MPVYNAETTINDTLLSLVKQDVNFRKFELIVVNDGSRDGSERIIRKILESKFKNLKFLLCKKEVSEGLATAYNTGIYKAKGEIVVTMHQDIILEAGALKKLVSPILNDSQVVATFAISINPEAVWNEYSFWQKCLFSRIVGRTKGGIDGKFNAFRKSDLEGVGLFDQRAFLRAGGEDADIRIKLLKKGQIVSTDAVFYHIHERDPNFGLRKFFYKHQQYANAQGVILRRYGVIGWKEFGLSFSKELLFMGLFVPYLRMISGLLILVFVFIYTKEVYLSEYRDPRILVLPVVNFSLLPVCFVYALKGFVEGKQTV
jgi:glycosyltransferase involved in cell wall biosynthesis